MKRWVRRGVDGVLSAESTAHPVLRGVAGAIRWLRTLARPARYRRLRSEQMTRLVYAGAHFQGSTFTLPDRFPALFARCRQEFGAEGSPRLLSFGCSTGEEVLTLARYLPKARIVGVDLNRWCLRQCRRKAGRNGNLSFLHARSAGFDAARGFDAIFCLAVLQRGENAEIEGTVLKTGFLFRDFAAAIAMLDAKLKPGGLLFIDQADFSFMDTPTFAAYDALEFAMSERTRVRPLFDRENRLKQQVYTLPRVFRKARSIGD